MTIHFRATTYQVLFFIVPCSLFTKGQRLVLSAEERRLLSRMGHKVPTMFPLSRSDERVIRAVRRKIRNKISAKASRARRQEYLQTLEMRIHSCHKENERLRSRVGELEKEKR
ncbi:unnamed protein product [Dibothriocephalus latus]|uniref:BZIP domain-containing protein n=1 Tax=Dibothriocephalus latus TaxID=60516 RepID=A0A3P6QTF6_DIBLA|nr:unnamed protein product [Dibothriocephalus latus]